MAQLVPQQLSLTAIEPDFVAADVAGDEFEVDTRTIVTVRNGDASSKTIDVVSQLPAVPGYAPANEQFTVPAGEDRELVFQPARPWADANDPARAHISYSDATSVTVAVRRA